MSNLHFQENPDQCSIGKAQNDKTLLKIKGCLITPFWYSDEINDNPIISEMPSKECLSSHVQDFNTGVINRGDYKIKYFWVAENLFLLQRRTWYHVQNYLQCILFFFPLSLSAPNPAALRMKAHTLEKSSTAFLKEWERSQTLQGSIYMD